MNNIFFKVRSAPLCKRLLKLARSKFWSKKLRHVVGYFFQKSLKKYILDIKNVNKKYEIYKHSKDHLGAVLMIASEVGKGGASKIAYDLLACPLKKRGLKSFTIATDKNYNTNADDIFTIDRKEPSILLRMYIAIENLVNMRGMSGFSIKNMKVFSDADVVHIHNWHGWFFSPFVLPELTALKPTICTLHDEYYYTSGCPFSFDCEKWLNNCDNCTNVAIYGNNHDNISLKNLLERKSIYDNSNFTVVCPSNWLKRRVEKSILRNKDIRLIYNGINEKIFIKYDKNKARQELGLPLDKKILFLSANGSITSSKIGHFFVEVYNYFKDYGDILFVAIGGEKTQYIEKNYLVLEYVFDEKKLAKYYSAADLFVYPSIVDNLPLVVLETLSCGTPIITFNTGGIPEIVEHMKTGYIAEHKNIYDLIKGIELFINDANLRKNSSILGRKTIEQTFTQDIMLDNYMALYQEVFEKRKMM